MLYGGSQKKEETKTNLTCWPCNSLIFVFLQKITAASWNEESGNDSASATDDNKDHTPKKSAQKILPPASDSSAQDASSDTGQSEELASDSSEKAGDARKVAKSSKKLPSYKSEQSGRSKDKRPLPLHSSEQRKSKSSKKPSFPPRPVSSDPHASSSWL